MDYARKRLLIRIFIVVVTTVSLYSCSIGDDRRIVVIYGALDCPSCIQEMRRYISSVEALRGVPIEIYVNTAEEDLLESYKQAFAEDKVMSLLENVEFYKCYHEIGSSCILLYKDAKLHSAVSLVDESWDRTLLRFAGE